MSDFGKANADVLAFLNGIVRDCKSAAADITEELGKRTKALSEQKLLPLRFERKKWSKKRMPKHLHEDVKIFKSKKTGRVQVGGGKATGSLWHLVNDGTYRSRPTHFMDEVLSEITSEIPSIVESKGKKLGG